MGDDRRQYLAIRKEIIVSPVFTGVGVALVTLFDDDGGVDAPGTAALAAELVGLGVRGVVVCGTTGEAAALSPDERTRLIGAVRGAVDPHTPVIAGTGAPTGRQAAELTARAFEAGADAALVLSPPGVTDPREYYDVVAKAATDRPLLAYHFPATSRPGIPVDLLAELPVVGVKDSTGSAERLLAELDGFGGDVYTGAATLLTMAGAVGAAGAILALANVMPETCAAAFAGDGRAQRALIRPHLTSARAFPDGIKALVAERFGVSRAARVGR